MGVVGWRTRDSLSHVSQLNCVVKPRSFSSLPAFLDLNGSVVTANYLWEALVVISKCDF